MYSLIIYQDRDIIVTPIMEIPVIYRNCFVITILSPSISIILNPSSPSAISNLCKLGLNAKPIDGAEL